MYLYLFFSTCFKLAIVLLNWHFNENFVKIIIIIIITALLCVYLFIDFIFYFYAVLTIGHRSIDLYVNKIFIIIIIIITIYHLCAGYLQLCT